MLSWTFISCSSRCDSSNNPLNSSVNRRIFSQWLPASKDYEVAGGFNIEMYSDPGEFKLGTEDPNYYSEIWIPLKRSSE